ncbi:cell adhesion molecule 3 isoform X1 [Protopterus annectens]|uniref:cell adhesion molecule 3 isoform X1 n=1 Tax=Protopterus annectens TaxID=7888 RepID=UPI001CFB3639|nr:cell adhesion molecule 3 isoform X1 [Protopterus annectens]
MVVASGSTVYLNCTVEDNDNSSLQWSNPTQQTLYFGAKRALRDHRIQLVQATSKELTISISNVSLADEGEYICSLFTMPVQTGKSVVTVLGVPKRPVITGYIGPVHENTVIRLKCESSGSKPAARLHWMKNKIPLHAQHFPTMEDPRDHTFTVSSLVEFNATKSDDEASVICAAEHPSITSEASISEQKIEVLYPPQAVIRASAEFPKEGMKLHLNCIGQGKPEPQLTKWMKKNGELPQHTTQEGNILTFTALNKSDAGVYICEVTNIMGSVEAPFSLTVYDKPTTPPLPSALTTTALPPSPPVLTTHLISEKSASSSNMADSVAEAAAPDPSALPHSGIDHAVIGGVVAVIVFILLCLLIVLGRYLIRHKGTYLTHEAKGSDDAPDADTAIINAEGGQASSDDKKEYFI